MKAPYYIFTLFLSLNLSCGLNYNRDKVSENVKKIIKEIAKENVLMDSAIGEAGIKPKQYERFEDLQKTATVSELIELTNHNNGVVRCYAFWDLIYKDSVNIFNIVKNHLNDDEIIDIQFGCMISEVKVGDFYLDLVSPPYSNDKSFKLSNSQQIEIMNLLWKDKKLNLNAKYDLLTKIEPIEANYEKIRLIALKENLPQAIFALSKFQNKQDIDFINKLFADTEDEYWAFRCVQFFPDTSFFKYLVYWHIKEIEKINGFDNSKIRVFYKALVQYQTLETKQLMLKSIYNSMGNGKTIHNKYLWIALIKYPFEYFDDVKSQIILDKVDIDQLKMFDYEIKVD